MIWDDRLWGHLEVLSLPAQLCTGGRQLVRDVPQRCQVISALRCLQLPAVFLQQMSELTGLTLQKADLHELTGAPHVCPADGPVSVRLHDTLWPLPASVSHSQSMESLWG